MRDQVRLTRENLVLHPAMLIGVFQGGSGVYLEQYPVKDGKLGAGRPVSHKTFAALTGGRGAVPTGFLETGNILYLKIGLESKTFNSGIFWFPAGIAPMRSTQWGGEVKMVPYPALVLVVANGTPYIFALKGKERPTPETKLWKAPFWNTSQNGQVCTGNCRIAEGFKGAEEMRRFWQDFWYGSTFSDHGQQFYNEKDLLHLWGKELVEANEFPDDLLVEEKNATLGAEANYFGF